jgi:hypothetical protein
MGVFKWIGVAIVFFVLFKLMSAGGSVATVNDTSCRVTLDRFSDLKTGMPYSTVENILGCPGKEMSRSDIAGYTTVMLGWDGKGSFGANMNAMFQNNSLVSKAQFGLR